MPKLTRTRFHTALEALQPRRAPWLEQSGLLEKVDFFSPFAEIVKMLTAQIDEDSISRGIRGTSTKAGPWFGGVQFNSYFLHSKLSRAFLKHAELLAMHL